MQKNKSGDVVCPDTVSGTPPPDMSDSPAARGEPRARGDASDETVVAEETRVQDLLDVVDDPDCRAILSVTSEEARSAGEISDACDIALSTTYRKLHLLTDADLLEERIRVRRTGKHVSEYYRVVEHIAVTITAAGDTELVVVKR